MDGNKFPRQLFPSFYNTGPPKAKSTTNVGGWGLYGQAFEVNHRLSEEGPGRLADWRFDTQHRVKGETWKPLEPIAAPLLAPSEVPVHTIASGRLPSASDFPEHMQNFYLDNSEDAFSTMSSLLGEHLYFGEGRQHVKGTTERTVNMSRMKHFLSNVTYRKCPLTYYGKGARRYSHLLDDAIHDIPPVLLAELLHEELALQRERAQFNEAATGGALGYFPLRVLDNSQEGCLVFPREASFSSLMFHKVVLEFDEDKAPQLSMSETQPLTMKLNGTVRQISVGSMQENVHVAVRSDYHCGVWLASPTKRLKPLEVVKTEQMATCINVSPHIPGELLVASENGAAYLWTVGKGLSKFREEAGNLYFNAQSSWRWCDFSAHPKVMQYTDRTGVELTDTRSDNCSYTLFRIGETPDCKSGERVILSKYLNDVRPYHHLITTQHSVYIMDERFSCLPMVKWEHMMADPPLFAQVVAGSPRGRPNKVLLGSQRSRELLLLQYSGGGETACHSVGPPLKLSRPAKSLSQLPAHIPHRQQQVEKRLGVPTAGFVAIHHRKAEECLCVLQLSEAGDIFYQILRPQTHQEGIDTPQPRNRTVGNAEQSVTTTRSKTPCEVEVVINGDEEEATASNTEIDGADESSVTLTPAPLPELMGSNVQKEKTSPRTASKDILSKWRRWLKALFSRSEPESKRILSHWTTETKGLVSCRGSRRDPLEDDQLQSLRKDLRDAMKRKDVLVHGATYLRPLEVAPPPDPVEPAEWDDDLSRRLTASWAGGWKSWWEDKLGMNREQRAEALRRKRRLQKRARYRRRVNLSDSFVSSTSYQSDLDNLSGWSSATSNYSDGQFAWSDGSNVTASFSMSNAIPEPKRATVVTLEGATQVLPLAAVDKVDGPSASSRLISSGKSKRPEQDYLSSLFGSPEPQEVGEDSGFPFMLATSQVSSMSSSQRDPCVVPSSQGSLFSQPKKKRARMGF